MKTTKHKPQSQAIVKSTKFNPFLGLLIVFFGVCLGALLRNFYNLWQLQNPFVDAQLVVSGFGFAFVLLLALFLIVSQTKK